MNKTARAAALDALLHVEENAGYSNIVLDKTLREYQLDKRDSALASHIFYGVLERRLTLDYYIRALLKHPNYTLHPVVLEVLRMGVYQLMFLDKVPESAVVNEAVNLINDYKKSATAGFVNGLLRELVRKKTQLTLPDKETLTGLSIAYSVPPDLIALWNRSYGKSQTLQILECFSQKSKTYIRLNNTKPEAVSLLESEAFCLYPHLGGAAQWLAGGNLTALDAFEQGAFHVQDLSSQYLCELLDPCEGETIIDTCAAPGGKSFTLAQRMNGTGRVYAYDLYKGRVKLIRAGAYRLGLKNVLASVRDARQEGCEVTAADRILCDVPCSGYGALRHKPEIRYKPLKSCAELPEIQYDILHKSSAYLKPGGRLVYSTCTLNPQENGAVADRFLKEHPDFEGEKITVPKGLVRTVSEPDNQLTLLPFAGDTDGFFVASFCRKK